jgi:hypothetical protein
LFFSWLCALPIPPTLRSLEISTFIEDGYGEGEGADEGEDESKALAAYFRQAGTGLQTLNINLLSGHRQFPQRNSIVSLISFVQYFRNSNAESCNTRPTSDIYSSKHSVHRTFSMSSSVYPHPRSGLRLKHGSG